MVRVLASSAVGPGLPSPSMVQWLECSPLVLYILGFSGVMVRVRASGAVDPGFPSSLMM